MINDARIATFACLLLLTMVIGACVKDSTMLERINKQPQDFLLVDARIHYEKNIETLCLPEFYLKPIIQTKGRDFFYGLEQILLWDNFYFLENEWSYIYEIPTLCNVPLKASLGYLIDEGTILEVAKDVNLNSNLIIQKYKESGKVHIFLSTIIGYVPNLEKSHHGCSSWLWTGDRQNFTGYQILTNTDGSIRSAYQYKNAKRKSVILDLYDKESEYERTQEIFSIKFLPIGTKGEGIFAPDIYCWDCNSPISTEESFCPFCGAGTGSLGEIIVTPKPDYCEGCGFLKDVCSCGDLGSDPIDVCPYCHSLDCSGECRNMGGDEGGSGGIAPDNSYYTIFAEADPVNSGSFEGNTVYKSGSEAVLVAEPNSGYVFAYWSGDLSGNDNPQVFLVTEDISTKAKFFKKDSECGRLFVNYNNNVLLERALGQMNEIITDQTRNKKEYGYYTYNNIAEYKVGNTNSVSIPQNRGALDFFAHNHPSGILIPSVDDIIGIYYSYINGAFQENSKMIIVTESGSLGIEVSDIDEVKNILDEFGLLSSSGEDLKEMKNEFKQMFNEEVLGGVSSSKLKNYEYSVLAIDYYILHGLKFTHRFSIDPFDGWSYAKYEDGKVKFEDCYY